MKLKTSTRDPAGHHGGGGKPFDGVVGIDARGVFGDGEKSFWLEGDVVEVGGVAMGEAVGLGFEPAVKFGYAAGGEGDGVAFFKSVGFGEINRYSNT